MSIPGTVSKDQQTQVNNELLTQESVKKEVLNPPGIKELHTKPIDEIASVLSNILKSRAGLVSFTYNIGENIEVVYNTNPFNQLRD